MRRRGGALARQLASGSPAPFPSHKNAEPPPRHLLASRLEHVVPRLRHVNLQNPLSDVRRLDPRDPLVAFQNGVHIADPFGGDLDQVPVAASFVSGEEFPAGARVSRWGFAFRPSLGPGRGASAVSLGGAASAVSLGGAASAVSQGGAASAVSLGGAASAVSLGGAASAVSLGGAASGVSLGGAASAVSLGGAGFPPGIKSVLVRDLVPPPSKVFPLS